MGYLAALWALETDTVLYTFTPAGHASPVNLSISRDFGRRESIMSIPAMDGVLSGHGRRAGPSDVRYVTFGLRIFTTGDNDAAYDLLAAAIAPGFPVRLVYLTDSGARWFTTGSTPAIKHTLTTANSWGSGGYVDFSVTWRIRPDWRAQYSEASDIWGVNDGVWGTGDGNWGAGFTIPLTTTLVSFNIDATGTAGSNLPTLPDTGPVLTVTGPFGGDGGIQILNFAAPTIDNTGVSTYEYFVIPKVASGVNCLLNFARQRFLMGGVAFRPTKPVWQTEYIRVTPGVVNGCQILCLGANATTGGQLLFDWFRKRA